MLINYLNKYIETASSFKHHCHTAIFSMDYRNDFISGKRLVSFIIDTGTDSLFIKSSMGSQNLNINMNNT